VASLISFHFVSFRLRFGIEFVTCLLVFIRYEGERSASVHARSGRCEERMHPSMLVQVVELFFSCCTAQLRLRSAALASSESGACVERERTRSGVARSTRGFALFEWDFSWN